MLQSSFKNYDEFKELFVAKNADGSTRRKNGILLAFYKGKEMRKYLRDFWPGVDVASIKSVGALYVLMKRIIKHESERYWYNHSSWCVQIMDDNYYSDKYQTDGHDGICIDGDISAYRYQNMEREGRVFKMKVGKMYRHIIDLTALESIIPETVKLYVCEELTREWEAYCAARVPKSDELVLHVDDNFKGIYSNTDCGRKYFHSCMQGDGRDNWKFYRDAVKAKAAYLTEGENGCIVARCIVFTEVTREDTGEVIRVAERQYSRPVSDIDGNSDELLQRVLVQKLVEGGYVDAYKKVGAGCGDARAYLDKDGNDLSSVELHITCNLSGGDYLSYQDTFKWYDPENIVAFNYDADDAYCNLDTTDSTFHEDEDEGERYWSEYNNEYIPEDEAIYVETREDYFWDNQVVYAYVDGGHEDCFEDDCLYIGCYYYYAGEECSEPGAHGIFRCQYCEEWCLEEDTCYSELTEEDYCCKSCLEAAEKEYKERYWYYSELLDEYYETEEEVEEAEREYKERYWHFSEYDEDYYEDEDDVTEWLSAFSKVYNTWERQTISYDSIKWLVANGEAVLDEETGIYYSKKALDEAISA